MFKKYLPKEDVPPFLLAPFSGPLNLYVPSGLLLSPSLDLSPEINPVPTGDAMTYLPVLS
jgi:hypothetical protein